MGLLTDPAGLRGRQVLVNNHGLICGVLYFASLVWFCLLASDQVNSATYLSENALLPGLVVLSSDVTTDTKNYLKELDVVMKESNRIPTAWIRGKFTQMSIESYVHNFTLNYPLGRGQRFEGKNVYGIIRGGGSSTEAIVLSVPFRGDDSGFPSTTASLALLLAITKYFREQKYWAKDLIMLITEHEQLGMQAWLEAYHGVTCGTKGVLEAGDLPARGGSIQAALNLELHSTKMKYIDVKILGLNGQLPNLDLVNLVHRICSKERSRHSFGNLEKVHNLPPNEQYFHSLYTMTFMVLGQATGVPDGNHGLFHRFGIEAVTMEGHEADGNGQHITLHHVGRVVEGVFRSVNNLLERFHQSYFFYLMTDTDRFVSIGYYIPCVGMMVGALLIRAFSLHVSLRGQIDDSINSKNDYNTGGVFITGLLCFLTGLVVFQIPIISTKILPVYFNFSTAKSVLTGFVGISIAALIMVEILTKVLGPREWTLLSIASLLYLGTMILAVAMSNFSLAFLSSIFIVPMALLVGSKLPRFVRTLICLLCQPLLLLTIVISISTYIHFGDLDRAVQTLAETLVLTSVDTLVYGATSQVIPILAYTPGWLMVYVLCRAKHVTTAKPKKD
ncbi:Gaa1-like, GPI transamidase component [Nesidiocoris tenuis]|uniref:Gaa1-like, GPI transamidase component n=1 Tax=Nesidiocoris tenuis TaxID=355587 RepID=A0ABN7B383_9HEMI|nr:Gaa1-like, GPI transamidase component [Nesidiocoris tenuis]